MAYGAQDLSLPARPRPFERPKNLDVRAPRENWDRRFVMLENERSLHVSEWRAINENFSPRRARFFLDKNAGAKQVQRNLINNVPLIAARTLRSGLKEGACSTSRPWFRITTEDRDLAEYSSVKQYLGEVARVLYLIIAKSNIYGAVHAGFGDLGNYGNECGLIDADFEDIARARLFPIGEYYIATGANGKPNTMYRKFNCSVLTAIERWGDKCSKTVQKLYDDGNYDSTFEVRHVIEPNLDQVEGTPGPKGRGYVACYYEPQNTAKDEMLEGGGYYEWPCFASRWEVMDDDAYGSGPGAIAIGDARALQALERRKGQLIDKMTAPTNKAPSSMAAVMQKSIATAAAPFGDVAFYDAAQGSESFAPLYVPNPNAVQVVHTEIKEHEGRIKQAYFYDLFLMISQMEGIQPRNELEILSKKEEQLMQLGPVLDNLHEENLNVIVNRVFSLASRASDYDNERGPLPPPPDELKGQELKIEYVSMLAQAQRAVGMQSVERYASFIGNLVAVFPDVKDKFDADQAADVYADGIGVDPSIVRSDEDVEALRAGREQQTQAANALNASSVGAQTAQVLSETDTGSKNALTDMMGMGGVV